MDHYLDDRALEREAWAEDRAAGATLARTRAHLRAAGGAPRAQEDDGELRIISEVEEEGSGEELEPMMPAGREEEGDEEEDREELSLAARCRLKLAAERRVQLQQEMRCAERLDL